MAAGEQAFDCSESFFEASVLREASSKVRNETYPRTLWKPGELD